MPCPWVNDWNLSLEIMMIKKVLTSVSKQRMKNKKRLFCTWLNADLSVLHTTHIVPLDILKHLLAFWSPLFSIHSVWHVRGQVELCLCIHLFTCVIVRPCIVCMSVGFERKYSTENNEIVAHLYCGWYKSAKIHSFQKASKQQKAQEPASKIKNTARNETYISKCNQILWQRETWTINTWGLIEE